MAALPALVDVLKRHRQIAAIYAGYENGEFLLVRPLRGAAARKLFDAPPNADFLYQITERRDGRLQTRIVLLDYGLAPISESTLPDYAFDARTRPWYLAALKTQSPVTTAPYVYFSTHEVGLTIAHTKYHRHGAYLVANSDLPGFSREEQWLLGALIRTHRRHFPLEVFQQFPKRERRVARRLSVLLRLAVLLHRGRTETPLPVIRLSAHGRRLILRFPRGWLGMNPLTCADLEQEADYLAAAHYRLEFS